MSRSKKPVVIVAAVLGALIILPLLILLISKMGGGSDLSGGASGLTISQGETASAGSYDLRQLKERAESLLGGEIANALREGDVGLDFVAGLKASLEDAGRALEKGKTAEAESLYKRVISKSEAQLEELSLAEKARAQNEATYQELQRVEYLKVAFERTYREAVEAYNSGLSALNAADYGQSMDDFELASAILGDLEARAIQQIAGLIESAESSLAKDDLVAARAAYEAVLEIDSANKEAIDGLAMLTSLDGITEEMKVVRELEAAGELDEALKRLDALIQTKPVNAFLRTQRELLAEKILQRDLDVLIEQADAFEANGAIDRAIESLQQALALRASPELEQRIEAMKAKQKAANLEVLLEDGFNALKAGRYADARDLYKEAVALAPESKEARTGYEKASSLYLAFIRYDQNLANADKFINEGRYPRAAKFFNLAMTSRPNNVPASKQTTEDRVRAKLNAQSMETPVTIISDKRTYVSIIRVFAPERFKDKELSLFPDVYTVKGTRKGYKAVEVELKVDATKPNQRIEVTCTEKL
ncbi:MAG: hypothetical protein AAGC73_01740 [Verrucomicrobiota bacterium]